MAYYDLRTGKRVAPPENGCLPYMLLGLVLIVSMVVAIIVALPTEMLILFGLIVLIVVAFVVAVLKKSFASDNKKPNVSETKATATAQKSSPMDVYKLANVLKGKAPADVLEHCDSIMHNAVLLETYIMQCENNGRISTWTAGLLRESYTNARERAKSSESQNKFR